MCLTLADPESSTQNLNYGWKWIWGFQLDAANTSADLTTLKPGAPDYVDGENCISMGNGLVCEDRVFSFHPWLQPVVMNGKLACLLQLSFRIYSVCVCSVCTHLPRCMCGGHWTIWGSQFCPSTKWDPGMEVMWPSLVTSTSTPCVILVAHWKHLCQSLSSTGLFL